MRFPGLFARREKPAEFVHGRVGYAIGDIHGRADLLERLLDRLEGVAAQDVRECGPPIAIFLGDYVDRGNESARVIELLLEGRPHGFERLLLRGNHEQSMAGFLEAPLANLAWLRHGGAETLLAYGVQPPSPFHAQEADWLAAAEAFRSRVPPTHIEFLRDLQRYAVLGDYVFVHAGVDPGRPIEAQEDRTLYWSRAWSEERPPWWPRRRFSHVVVHGHTPAPEPYRDQRRIGLDTGAYATGALSAARFEGSEVGFLTIAAEPPARPQVAAAPA